MANVPKCPKCGASLDGEHSKDCAFPTMSRDQALVSLIPAPRLTPDGKGWSCPRCGASVSCDRCQAVFEAIEYSKSAR